MYDEHSLGDVSPVALQARRSMIEWLQERLEVDEIRNWQPGQLVDQLRLVVRDFLRTLNLSNLTPEQKKALLDGAKWFFDNVIRPLDIPYIPQIVEGMVEDWVWSGVEAFLKSKLGI